MLTVHKIVIHEIVKNVKETKAAPYFAESLVSLKENTEANMLVEKINSAYEEDEIVYSSFLENTLSNFPEEFEKYEKSKRNDKEFLDFSTATLENLRLQLQKVLLAKGGYYVYAEYTIDKEDLIGIFLIRDTEGILFKKLQKSKGFKVDTITYLNLDKLAMACRISLTKYKKGVAHYLTLIKRNQEVISSYFYDWISTADKESSREYTDSLYDIISKLPLPLNKVTNAKYTIDELRQDVLAYIMGKQREVDIREISKDFYGDAKVIMNYAAANSIALDSTFKADKRGLKKFKHLNVNSDGIKFQFSHGDYLTKKIRFSPENNNMVIIESERFANALRKELEEYNLNV